MSGHPAPDSGVEEKQGQLCRNEAENLCAALRQPPCETGSLERLDVLRAGADRFRAEAITRWLSLRQKEKHMKESRVCLAVKTREKRR